MKNLKNLFYLFSAQIVNLLSPLLVLPMLTRNFNELNLSKYLFYTSLSVFCVAFIEYGFNLSAVKKGATSDSFENLIFINSYVTSSKLFLCLITFLAIATIVFIKADNIIFLFSTFFFAFSNGLMPTWYFQVKGNLKPLAIVLSLTRISAFFLIYVVVIKWRLSSEYTILALAFCSFIGIIVLNRLVLCDLDYPKLSLSKVKFGIKSSFSSFLYLFSTSVFTSLNVVILGFLSVSEQIVAFGVSEKIVMLFISPLWSIQRIFLPYFTRLINEKNSGEIRKTLLITFALHFLASVFIVAVINITNKFLLRYFNIEGIADNILILNLLALTVIPIYLTSVISVLYFIPMNLERDLTIFTVLAAFINLSLAWTLAPRYGAIGMIISVLTSECFILIGSLIYLDAKKINFFRKNHNIAMRT